MDKAKRNDAKYRADMQKFVIEYWSTHPCVDCGNADIRVLQFDHRDAKLKTANIAHLMRQVSVARLKSEIEKCDVRCANCHQIRTGEQFGWWRNAHVLALATNQ